MSLPLDREFMSQAIIVLSACVGGWMVFAQPKADELATLEKVIAKRRTQTAKIDHAFVAEIADETPRLRRRSSEIQARGWYAQDSSLLYGKIMSLAKDFEVQVKNMRPGVQSQSRDKSIGVTRIDMTVEGEYERIAAFLDAIDEIGAYLRLVSVQIAPARKDNRSYSVMQLGFEAFQFAVPEVVDQLRENTDGRA